MHTKSLNLEIRSIDTATRSVDVVASTDAVDSYGEIVEQSWDLSRFNANPIVLYAHDAGELPIGVASSVRVEGGALRARITFAAAEANPKAEQVFRLVQAKVLRGVSVGFMPGSVRTERRNGVDTTVLSDNVLFEISVVPIPANPEALARAAARERAANDAPDLGDLMGLDPAAAKEHEAWFRAEPSQPRPRPPAESADDDTLDLGDLLGGAA